MCLEVGRLKFSKKNCALASAQALNSHFLNFFDSITQWPD